MVLAVLLLINAARAFQSSGGSPSYNPITGSSPVLTGVVSLVAALGFVAAAFYLFWF